MANRFCAGCGAKLMTDARFCAECGEGVPGVRLPRSFAPPSLQRWAPVFVVLAVVAIGGGAIGLGLLSPKTPPPAPRRDAPPAAAAGGSLPEGHPPIAIPEAVKQTIRDMETKAAAAPDDVDAWKRLAEVQYRASQIDPAYLSDAASSYKHILEREPEHLDAIRALGNIAFDQQQSDAAIDYYQRYLKLKPDDLEVKTDLGTMFLSAGKATEAMAVYKAVLATNPAFFQAQFNMAIAYRSLGQPEEMLKALEKARDLAPDDKTRTQVDQLLARAKGQPAAEGAGVAAAAPPAAAPPAAAAGGTFQADVEALFRQHPILGPKLQRIEWEGAESAKVFLRDFPMDQMGPEMQTMFVDRMKGRIQEKKDAHQVTQTTRIDLVDEATGRVMGTITD